MKAIACIRQQADVDQIRRCRARIGELHATFDYISHGLELVANAIRLRILFLLYEEGKLCVCDISDILEMPVPAVSQHLRRLRDRNLIETERQAQTIYYSLTNDYESVLRPLYDILEQSDQAELV